MIENLVILKLMLLLLLCRGWLGGSSWEFCVSMRGGEVCSPWGTLSNCHCKKKRALKQWENHGSGTGTGSTWEEGDQERLTSCHCEKTVKIWKTENIMVQNLKKGALGKPFSLAGKNNSRKPFNNLAIHFHNYHQDLMKSLIVLKLVSWYLMVWYGWWKCLGEEKNEDDLGATT